MSIRSIRPLAIATVLAGLAAVAQPGSVHAAHSYDSCTGFIDSLPATITTQGTWCLRKHLSTGITNGSAIEIAANNVTIDCNNFRLGGLAAGPSSTAKGISAAGRQNVVVNNCQIRGFFAGIHLVLGAGHVVEGNRLDNNLVFGISLIETDNSLIARNRIFDTGGHANYTDAFGIDGDAEIINNAVSGVFLAEEGSNLVGIRTYAHGLQVTGNTVTGLAMNNASRPRGLAAYGDFSRIADNHIVGSFDFGSNAVGISLGTGPAACIRNSIAGFNTAIDPSCVSNENIILP